MSDGLASDRIKSLFIKDGTIYVGTDDNGLSISQKLTMGIVESPVFSPDSGKYTEGQEVSITSETPDAIIYYTTDGSTPMCDRSELYDSPIILSDPLILVQAVACKTNWEDSSITSAFYKTIQQVADPGFKVEKNPEQVNTDIVTITTSTSDATIHYALNNGALSCNSGSIYLIPFSVGADEVATLRAIACKPGWIDSNIVAYSEKKRPPTPQTPMGL